MLGITTLRILSEDERKRENKLLVDRIRSSSDSLVQTANDLQVRARRTFLAIEAMSWLTFGVGLLLVVFSLAYYAIVRQAPEVLGLSALGLANFAALFFYKPMDKIQTADTEFSEQAMILNTWATTINLQLLSMDSNNPESVTKTAHSIQGETLKSLTEIHDYIESHDENKQKVSKKTGHPTQAQPDTGSPKLV